MKWKTTLCLAALVCVSAAAAPPETSVEVLLDTDETVLGQAFTYPAGRARITAARVTVPPGATVAPHLHPVPLFAYILQGELIVDYGSRGTRTYGRGDAFVEAFDWAHRARNAGKGNVVILAVYSGAVGADNSIPESGSEHSFR